MWLEIGASTETKGADDSYEGHMLKKNTGLCITCSFMYNIIILSTVCISIGTVCVTCSY
jgi:hypothetical protein